jgi:ribosomal protein L11 methylase PrmA
MTDDPFHPASFRDPSGHIFVRDEKIYRQVNKSYQKQYDLLLESGLYKNLTDHKLLIPHVDAPQDYAVTDDAYLVIAPETVPFISYPYEWSFSQLQDAALATLTIQQRALDYGMSLKDASAYNIQFVGGRPMLIDTLSFEQYHQGQPWVAYAQFCRHFLAPLALMARRDVRLSALLRVRLDGIELDLASRLLGLSSWLRFSLLTHIHLHARAQKKYADARTSGSSSGRSMSLRSLKGLIDNLQASVRTLKWSLPKTAWAKYYDEANYSDDAMDDKKQLVQQYLGDIKPASVWDLGANVGVFSRVAAGLGIRTVAFDFDPVAVENNYRDCRSDAAGKILPLVLDLTNPSPALGWAHTERMSLAGRGPADCVMALALLHHLAISNNLPFGRIAEYLAQIGKTLIIEFVPKSDSMVQRLLSSREDIFDKYDRVNFEKTFDRFFETIDSQHVRESERTIYLMKSRGTKK